ncbi:MAG: dTDP-4-dehydrorhamnose 3,5-epimerase [Acidobacteriota bacterium]
MDGLPEVIRVEPAVHGDARGFFLETYHAQKYADGGITARFVQDNHSRSRPGTLRGLHGQLHSPQGKLVRAVEGAIFDVAIDVRVGSPTFGRWVGATLTAENFHQLWVPEGFLHGFCVVGDAPAQVEYKCTDLYDPADEISAVWNDPEIGVEWPLAEPLLSGRDAAAPTLAALREADKLPRWTPGHG